jgi:hypothetical protein
VHNNLNFVNFPIFYSTSAFAVVKPGYCQLGLGFTIVFHQWLVEMDEWGSIYCGGYWRLPVEQEKINCQRSW